MRFITLMDPSADCLSAIYFCNKSVTFKSVSDRAEILINPFFVMNICLILKLADTNSIGFSRFCNLIVQNVECYSCSCFAIHRGRYKITVKNL